MAWRGRCLVGYHSMMADLKPLLAVVYGQPPVNCGVPILDPIPGGSSP
jgi:hypothetical protein